MDARTARTAEALHSAVLRLGAEGPIDGVSTVELAAAAGVTRRTLYNHAPNPQQLLVRILKPELDAVHESFRADLAAGRTLGETWTAGEERLAAHLSRYAEVYGAGVLGPHDHMSPTLAHMLSDAFELGVLETLTRTPLSAEQALLTARFVGHGLVGAIEAWLLTPERAPRDFVTGALRSIPAWISGVEGD